MPLTEDDLLYLDKHLVAIHKPSGLSVHRGWDQGERFALQETRDLVGQYVYPVHRLDRPTSGVLVFALSSEGAKGLQESLQAENTRKRYLALVRGIPDEVGVIDHAIPARSGGDRVEARTSFRRLCTVLNRYSLVEATLHTGRLHQIRRHFKHISHPLIGDTKYGKGEHNRLFRAEYNLTRLALHAFHLSFDHPVTGERLTLLADFPEDLTKPFEEMGVSEDCWRSLLKVEEQD